MKESTRILRFVIIGTLNALITALVVWVMMDIVRANYLLSNISAYVLAQIHNFLWSKYWIFPSDDGRGVATSTIRQVFLFLFAFALAYGAQFLFLVLLVETFHCNEYLAQFFGLFVYGTINFLMNRRVTFKS